MKPVYAWAAVDEGELALFDYRLPIVWHKMCADDWESKGFRIARVEIREIKARPVVAKRNAATKSTKRKAK